MCIINEEDYSRTLGQRKDLECSEHGLHFYDCDVVEICFTLPGYQAKTACRLFWQCWQRQLSVCQKLWQCFVQPIFDILLLSLLLLLIIIAFLVSCNSLNNNAEWIYLFDGESTNGWRAYNGEEIPSKWAAIDGNLTFDTQWKKEENWEGGGDIIYYLEEFDVPNSTFRNSLSFSILFFFFYIDLGCFMTLGNALVLHVNCRKDCHETQLAKGQLISKGHFGAFKFIKNPIKFLE